MEVLDAANEEKGGHESNGEHGDTDSEDDGDHDGDDRHGRSGLESEELENGDGNSESGHGKREGIIDKAKALVEGHNDDSDGRRDPLSELRDHKDHRKQLHRSHRGLVQFKTPRMMDWLVTKARHGKGHLEGLVARREKGARN